MANAKPITEIELSFSTGKYLIRKQKDGCTPQSVAADVFDRKSGEKLCWVQFFHYIFGWGVDEERKFKRDNPEYADLVEVCANDCTNLGIWCRTVRDIEMKRMNRPLPDLLA